MPDIALQSRRITDPACPPPSSPRFGYASREEAILVLVPGIEEFLLRGGYAIRRCYKGEIFIGIQ